MTTGHDSLRPDARQAVRRVGERRGAVVDAQGYLFTEGSQGHPKCARCGLFYGPLLRRAVIVAAVGGTCLVAINHGDALLRLDLTSALLWSSALSYVGLFLVFIYSALMAGHSRIK